MDSNPATRILMSRGAEFARPEERIREYCEFEVYRDRGYRGGYDDHLNVSDSITPEDIEAANNFYAGVDPLDRRRILGNPVIPTRLALLEDGELGALTEEEWNGAKTIVRSLLSTFMSIPNIQLTKTMKILHLKRPHLFPPLDFYVVRFLTGNDMATNRFSVDELVQIGMNCLEIARSDLSNNSSAFEFLQARLADLPTPLPAVRMYDILCWTQEKWINSGDTSAKYGVATKSLDLARRGSGPSSTQAPPVTSALAESFPPGEITSIREFRQVVAGAEGVIVITGTKPPRIHRTLCELVTEERFQENVKLSEKTKVRYYWRTGLVEARREFGAMACKRCRP